MRRLLLMWLCCLCFVVGLKADETPLNPLTGAPLDDLRALSRPPIIVKVSNSPALVRPQAGIGAADWVFEHYTEVGITRLSAVFLGNAPQRVGSIRSARLIDYELAAMFGGLLAFAGASIGVDKYIYGSERVIADLCRTRSDHAQCMAEADIIAPRGARPPSDFVDRAYKGVLIGAPFFFRDPSIPVPHNYFVNLDALWQLDAQRRGASPSPSFPSLRFDPTPPDAPHSAARRLEVRYLTTLAEWRYDRDSGTYARWSDGQPHADALSGQQVRASNVIVLFAEHNDTDIVESEYQNVVHYSVEIKLWFEGELLLLRDGRQYVGRWLRPTREDMLAFVLPDGTPLPLQVGSTWVQVVRLPAQILPEREWVRTFE